MIKHDLADLFRQNSIHKKFVINYDGGTITNFDLFMEEFSLEESISSEEELRFGSCEASVIRFPISNVFTALNGKVLDVSVVLDHNEDKPLKIGKYKVASDVPTADRKRKDITAYDALYDVINADVADWYNSLLPNADSTVTLKQLRDSFFGYFGIEQVEVSLINDSMIVTKTIQPTELSGSMVANAICELNGCFGHINRDGLMDYVFLENFEEAIYPSDELYPADDLFPSDSNYHVYTSSDYEINGCDYQEYVSHKITGLEIRQDDESAGAFVGERENVYVVSDNFLTYGKSTEEMTTIAQNMLNVINGIEYRPFMLNTFRGNPCVEVGDGIKIYTSNQIIQSYVLRRTLTGIQSLKDEIEADGKEYRTAQVNTIQNQIRQLKGKTNTLERTSEKTLSKISDFEEETATKIEQLSDSIAIVIDEKGNIVTGLNLDTNGVSFAGNVFVIKSKNFTLDKDGNGTFSGKLEAASGSFKGTVTAETLVAYEKINMRTELTLPPSTTTIMSVEEGMSGGFHHLSSTRLAMPLPLRVGNVLVSGNVINGASYLDIESQTGGVRMASSSTPTLRPLENDAVDLGNSNYYYKQIYCNKSAVDLSDENKKEDIRDITEKYEQLYFKVKPKLFRFKNTENSNHDRIHIGTTAQGVEKAMEEVGLDALELAFFCKDVAKREVENEDGTLSEELVLDEDGNKTYNHGLRYGEWIMLNTHMVQKLYKKVDEQQTEIDELKESVSFLMKKLGGMADE